MSDKENERSRSASRESKISEKSHQSGSHKSEASRSYSRSPTPKSARSQRSASRSRSRSRSQSRSPSRSRSRSRSRSKHRHRRSYSRSSSRSRRDGYNDRRRGYYRTHCRSPMSSRRRLGGSRVSEDNPEPSRCLGVFGLSLYTQERDLREVFTRYGPVEDVQVVYDRQSGRSRGFAFVYFRATHNAMEAKDRCNGIEVDGRRIRVDYSITERAHTPTPGIYLGKPTSEGRGKRSPSPYYRRSGSRYSRSRSRSFSPRYEERNEMGW
ncbi:transformer-2 protein homolog alpha isoform X5 [Octopus sinensis]|uniref:Transformer-2 protein homolog alpha isoform X5 n=1 Tax=Octopus sinensis TaxID=2607531 RepID=A0A7E6ETV4_9MOLL|nr:transformer-2 protein homolog alpha isoform X5 [Octopus sinensis]